MTKNRDISKILDQNTTFTATVSVGSGTANVFANSTVVKVANSTVNTYLRVPSTTEYAGNYYLHANGTWQLVAAGATPGGANTQVQFNDSTALGGTAGFTFDKATNNAVIANTLTVGTATINSTNYSQTANNALNLGGTAAASYQLNSTLAANVATMTANNATWHGTSVFANSTGAYPTSNSVGAVLGNTISRVIITGNSATFISTLAAGDTTVTGFVNATTVVNSAAHTIGTTLIANTLGVYHTGIVNAASHTTTGFLANATHVVPTSNSSGQTLGNTISRWVVTANSLTVSGGASPDSNTLGTALGTTTQRWILTANSVDVGPNFVANTLGAYHTATINAASFTTTGFLANTTGVFPTSNSSGQNLGNTISRWVITGNSATFTSTLAAGDTTITGFVNATVSVNSAAHTIGSTFIANTLGLYHTGTINAASHTTTGFLANTIGTYPTSNSSGQNLGNTISRWVLLANTVESTGLANLNSLNVVAATNTATLFATTSAAIGANVVANTTAVLVGNSTFYVNVTSQAIKLANSTVNTTLLVPNTVQYSATNYFLHANGTWVQVTSGGGSAHIYQAYSATGGQTTFTVSGGYAINQIDVYENGIHLSNTEYTQDGSTVVLASGALAGEIIEVVGWSAMGAFTPTASGSNTNIQFNDSTLLGGSAGFTFDKATNNVVLANTITVGSSTVNAVANSTTVKLSNSTVNTAFTIPSAAQYAGSYFLHANGTWQLAGGLPGGSDTYVQFNDGGASLNGTAGFTFTKGSNNAVIANTLTVGANFIANSLIATHATQVNSALFTTTGFRANTIGTYPASNTVGQLFGNTISRWDITANGAALSGILSSDTVNAVTSVNSALIKVGTAFIANTLGAYHTGTINAASFTTTGLLANTTGIVPTSNSSGQNFGNTISRWVMTANSLTVSGGVSPDSNTLGTALGTTTQRWVALANTVTTSGGVSPDSNTLGTALGTTTQRWVLNANTIDATGAVTFGSTLAVTTSVNSALFTTTGFRANTIGVYPTSNSSGQLFGNTISRWAIFANTIDVTTSITANGALGTAAQILTSNSLGGVYWAAPSGGGNVTKVGTPADDQVGVWTGDGTIEGTAGFTFSAASNNAAIANTLTVGANFIANGLGAYHTATINAAAFTTTGFRANTIGTYPTSNSSGQLLGNTISRWSLLANTIESTGLANVSALNVVAATNTATLFATTSAAVGANVVANTTAMLVGNSTFYVNVTSQAIKLANSTSNTALPIPSAADWAGSKFLHANGTWASPTASAAAGGPNTSVQFNDSTTIAGNAAFTFDKATNTVAIVETAKYYAGNSTVNNTINSVAIAINLSATANLTSNTMLVQVANSSGTSNLTPVSLAIGSTLLANSTGLYPGSNTSGQSFGNTISRWDIDANTVNLGPITLGTAVAGTFEYDSVQTYNTIDTSSGRGAIPVEQYFRLSANGSTIGTIANFFGTTSNPTLVASAHYIIDIYCYFLNTTAGTVTWTFTNSAAPTSQNIIYDASGVTGSLAAAGSASAPLHGSVFNGTSAAQALTTSATLTTAVNHYVHFKIFLRNGTGTSLKIQATKLVGGTITPLMGSWWFCRRVSPNNIGTFAA